jgi:4-hydroxyphenylpyruvate dioxygenase-like putative hemolysin
MKKTFALSHPKLSYQRIIEAAKNEVKQYIKKERKHALPEGADFWGFTCKFGQTAEKARVIHEGDINTNISSAQSQHWKSFYLEVVPTPKKRTPRPDAN